MPTCRSFRLGGPHPAPLPRHAGPRSTVGFAGLDGHNGASCIAIAWWYAMAPALACPLAKEDFATSLAILAIALCNGSHGMGFLQKLAPMGALVACELSALALCGELVLPRWAHSCLCHLKCLMNPIVKSRVCYTNDSINNVYISLLGSRTPPPCGSQPPASRGGC